MWDLNPGSSVLKVDTLTTRPTRRSKLPANWMWPEWMYVSYSQRRWFFPCSIFVAVMSNTWGCIRQRFIYSPEWIADDPLPPPLPVELQIRPVPQIAVFPYQYGKIWTGRQVCNQLLMSYTTPNHTNCVNFNWRLTMLCLHTSSSKCEFAFTSSVSRKYTLNKSNFKTKLSHFLFSSYRNWFEFKIVATDSRKLRVKRGVTCDVTVSMSAFLACHQCYCAGSSLVWGLNLRAVVCGIFWSSSPGVFSGYSGFLPSISLMVQPKK